MLGQLIYETHRYNSHEHEEHDSRTLLLAALYILAKHELCNDRYKTVKFHTLRLYFRLCSFSVRNSGAKSVFVLHRIVPRRSVRREPAKEGAARLKIGLPRCEETDVKHLNEFVFIAIEFPRSSCRTIGSSSIQLPNSEVQFGTAVALVLL